MHPNTQTSSSQYSSSASLSSSSLPPPCSRAHGHRRQHHQTHRIINISIITIACSHHIYHGGNLGVRVKVHGKITPTPQPSSLPSSLSPSSFAPTSPQYDFMLELFYNCIHCAAPVSAESAQQCWLTSPILHRRNRQF